MKTMKESIAQLRNNIPAPKSTHDCKYGIAALQLKIDRIENEIKEVRGLGNNDGSTHSSIASLKQECFEHINNIEAVIFAHQQLQLSNEITFKWVLQDYQKMFHIGMEVSSPIFHTKMGGYSFRMMVNWSGPNKRELGLYLQLHRGNTPHRFLQDYSTEFTLEIHGKYGMKKSLRFSLGSIDKKFKETSFVIKKGMDACEKCAGYVMLTAPYDDYIVNNSLLISCTLHL